ncbi:response regulator transcription factor [Pseudomonas sp. WAC2]|uniref:response regulator transcription factor n=1 Tax=Pseudomonas sp. WAC2 TaxID=3055057 RepID=UPI0025B071EE|nr:response regulator transcription factor [Pseudomonas sp. WAC2]MDN3235705.1 response regulator transcription factor [Pseudomonas sp. WAC2]
MPTILLVEDDTALAELIATYLTRHAFAVFILSRGDEVQAYVRKTYPDLVILDLMLPGLDGLQVCRQLRADHAGLPILMLTARDDSHDQVVGLELGADDYVTKPCEPRVLLARIRTLLRRSQPETVRKDASRVTFGRLEIDLTERVVQWRDQPIELSSGEFDLLVALARHAGEVQSRDQLLQQVRGIEFNGIDRSIDVAISKLRRKFEDTSGEARRIKTVWGKGYLFSRSEWED